MNNTLLATVGASLITNIIKDEKFKPLYEQNKITEIVEELSNSNFKSKNERFLGAEINSTESILKQGILEERKNLFLLVSDTQTGKKAGEIIKKYFQLSKEFSFENIEIVVIQKLDDSKEEDFKRYGLRNLVKSMATILQKHSTNCVINATGGYKAQIAFALALGQGMDIPVYYMFERFPTVIKLPPLPLSLDYKLYSDYIYFLDQFDEEDIIPFDKEIENQYKILSEKLIPLFDIEVIDEKKFIALNPMGQVFIEAAKFLFFGNQKKEIILKKRKNEDMIFQHSNSEGHSLELILSYRVQEKFKKLDFIEKIYVVGSNEKEKSGRASKVKIMGDEIKIGLYLKTGTLDFKIITTAENTEELIKAKEIIKDFMDNNF